MFKKQAPRKCSSIGTLVIVFIFFSFKPRAGTVDYLKPQTTFIIVSDKPDNLEIKSARLLSKWLKNIYQTESGFQVVKESLEKNTGNDILITIGKTKFSIAADNDYLQPYSFVIKRKNQIVSIEGATPMGTLLGTNYFLDHICGVRFYLTGDLFTSMPESKSVALEKTISVTEIPFTKYLFSTGYRNTDEFNWAQNNGLLRKDWGSHQHSMGDRFYNDTIFKLFPEIFPTFNGQRYFPQSKHDQNWEPDFAEPKFVDAAAYSAIQYFKQNKQIDYISFSVMDSKSYPTEGKMGDFLKNYPDTKQGKYRGYTDAYVSFLNKLATRLQKELPGNGITNPKTIVYLVYGNVHLVPKERLNSNILPVTVYHISESLMDSLTKDGGLLDQWSHVTSRIGNDDWAEGKGFIYPRIYTNLVSAFLRNIQKNKVSFDYAHLEIYPNWSLDGPKYYLMSKIYWNPQANTDSLLSLFCTDMFGKAAMEMKDYFSTLENLNASMNNNPKQNRRIGVYATQLPLNENELSMLHQARQYIDKAYSIAQTDEQKKRIDLFSKGLKMSEGFFEIYNSKTVDMNKVNELKDYLKSTVAGNAMMMDISNTSNFLTDMNALLDNIVNKKK